LQGPRLDHEGHKGHQGRSPGRRWRPGERPHSLVIFVILVANNVFVCFVVHAGT